MFRRLQNHPMWLERAYKITVSALRVLEPVLRKIGFRRIEGIFARGERLTKGAIFNCQMCGQCTLHDTGMTCPMNCPKNLRNGPCGGVRANGNCEIKPDMGCVWLEAWERAAEMGMYSGAIRDIQPPLDRRKEGSSAWLNMLEGKDNDLYVGWIALDEVG